MKVLLRPFVLALVLLSSVALAAAGRVTMQYRGPLGDALKQIASQSGINLVVSGDFNQPVQLMFQDIPAEQALQIIAKTNHLQLDHEGNVWTLSPVQPGAAAPAVVPPPPAPGEVPGTQGEGEEAAPPAAGPSQLPSSPGVPRGLNVPPLPPVPPMGPMRPRIHRSDRDLVGTGAVTVAEGQTVDDAVAYGGTLTVNGNVEGDAVAFGGNVHLGPKAKVKGEAVAFGGSVVREEGAEIGGQQLSFGGRRVGSAIAEGISQGVANVQNEPQLSQSHPMSALAWFLMEFVLCFGMGFLFLMFIPSPMKQIEGELRRDPLRCGATGIVGALALALLSVLLAVTIIGVLPMLVLWLAIVVALCMGYTAIANELGMRLPVLRGKKTQAAVLAIGTVILLLISRIPVLGPVVLSLTGLIGLGAIIRTRFGTRPRGFPEPV